MSAAVHSNSVKQDVYITQYYEQQQQNQQQNNQKQQNEQDYLEEQDNQIHKDQSDERLLNELEKLEEQIEVLGEYQEECMKTGKYIEAEMAQKKIKEQKERLQKKREKELKSRHLNEKLGIERSHLDEFNQFNQFWDAKMKDFNNEADNIEAEFMSRQDQEINIVADELDKVIPFVQKDSSEVLNLLKMEQHLAKQSRFLEAHQVQQARIQLQKEEGSNWALQRAAKIKNQLSQLRQRQNNELNALRQKIMSGQDEQRKNRSIELQRLLQKYQNSKKELEDQQQKDFLTFSRQFTSRGKNFLRVKVHLFSKLLPVQLFQDINKDLDLIVLSKFEIFAAGIF